MYYFFKMSPPSPRGKLQEGQFNGDSFYKFTIQQRFLFTVDLEVYIFIKIFELL
jgi:hypothetical protein